MPNKEEKWSFNFPSAKTQLLIDIDILQNQHKDLCQVKSIVAAYLSWELIDSIVNIICTRSITFSSNHQTSQLFMISFPSSLRTNCNTPQFTLGYDWVIINYNSIIRVLRTLQRAPSQFSSARSKRNLSPIFPERISTKLIVSQGYTRKKVSLLRRGLNSGTHSDK